MPPLEDDGLNQKALYWRIAEGILRQDANGEIQVYEPAELDVRWETRRTESVSFQAQGATVAFEATVVVPREVTVGSLMWLGSFDDWYGTGTTGDWADLGGRIMQVQAYDEVPDADDYERRKVAKLTRFRDKMPTILDGDS